MLNVIGNVIKKSKFKFDYIDLGGGMGIQYDINSKKLNYSKYSKAINQFFTR